MRRQWNYYVYFSEKSASEIPDDITLLLGGGVVFHRLIQSLKDNGKSYWDKVEVECEYKVKLTNDEIVIIGHADALRGDEVYEFKHTRTLPMKPHFQHRLQLNFYLGALNKMKGRLVYTGYNEEGGIGVREFPLLYSDWYMEHLVNKAEVLHALLKSGEPPRCSCRDRKHEGGNVL
jgi:hypothetical protein